MEGSLTTNINILSSTTPVNGLPTTTLETITLNCTRKVVLCESDPPFSERVVDVWNNLPASVDFKSLSSFKRTLKLVGLNLSKFLKCFKDVFMF